MIRIRTGIVLMILSTFLIATGQLMWKLGVSSFVLLPIGFIFYGLGAICMIEAFHTLMFNLNKVLELTTNNGRCSMIKASLGLDLGNLTTYNKYEDLKEAFAKQIDYFID